MLQYTLTILDDNHFPKYKCIDLNILAENLLDIKYVGLLDMAFVNFFRHTGRTNAWLII